MATTVVVTHPSGELYGSDRVLVESVLGLLDRGCRVVVTLPAGGPLVARLTDVGASVVLVPTPVLRKSYLSAPGLLRLAAATLRSLPASWRLLVRERPAAVLVNTLTVPLWLPLARLRGVPVVCHVHEAEGSARPVVRRLLTLPLLLAGTVVCNSRFSRSVLASSWPRLGARATVLLNGVAGPGSAGPPREDLAGQVRLLYVGRLSERKGVDVAVSAVALLRARGLDARLDVVGDVFAGYEWFEERLRALVAEDGLTDVVRFHGFVPDVWPHLSATDVLLVPSRVDEPFGNTAVEGVLAMRPVVAGATSGLLEATEGMTTARTVRPGDPEALADAVVDLVDRWPEVRAQVQQDHDRAVRTYSPETYRRRMAELVLAGTR